MRSRIVLPAAALVLLAAVCQVRGQDGVMWIGDVTILNNESGAHIPVYLTNVKPASGVSFTITFDPSVIQVDGFTLEGSASESYLPADPHEDSVIEHIDNTSGWAALGIIYGLAVGPSYEDLALPVEADQQIAAMVVTPAGPLLDKATPLEFDHTQSVPEVWNTYIYTPPPPDVMEELDPELRSGSARVRAPQPRITGLDPTSARSGEPVTATGEFFLEPPEMALLVADVGVPYTYEGPNQITFTMPDCAASGPVEVKLCFLAECSTPQTIDCVSIPPPVVDAVTPAEASTGERVTILGSGFDEDLLSVEINGFPVLFTWLDSSTVEATVPDCFGGTDLPLRVCNGSTCVDKTGVLGCVEPVVTELSPSSGEGDETVEIVGLNFIETVKVFVNDGEVPFTYNGPTSLTVQVPPCSGGAPITVAVERGTKRASADYLCASYFVRGDATGDGKLNLADAITILLVLFAHMTTDCQDALDVDDDEKIGLADVIALLSRLFRTEGRFEIPEPNPDPGPDPTTENNVLGCER